MGLNSKGKGLTGTTHTRQHTQEPTLLQNLVLPAAKSKAVAFLELDFFWKILGFYNTIYLMVVILFCF